MCSALPEEAAKLTEEPRRIPLIRQGRWAPPWCAFRSDSIFCDRCGGRKEFEEFINHESVQKSGPAWSIYNALYETLLKGQVNRGRQGDGFKALKKFVSGGGTETETSRSTWNSSPSFISARLDSRGVIVPPCNCYLFLCKFHEDDAGGHACVSPTGQNGLGS